MIFLKFKKKINFRLPFLQFLSYFLKRITLVFHSSIFDLLKILDRLCLYFLVFLAVHYHLNTLECLLFLVSIVVDRL